MDSGSGTAAPVRTAAHTLPPIPATNRGTASVSHPPLDLASPAVAARVRPGTPATEPPESDRHTLEPGRARDVARRGRCCAAKHTSPGRDTSLMAPSEHLKQLHQQPRNPTERGFSQTKTLVALRGPHHASPTTSLEPQTARARRTAMSDIERMAHGFVVSLGEHALPEPPRRDTRVAETVVEAELASWEATAAELRRQLAGTNALLATARAQRQAVLDLCDHEDAKLIALEHVIPTWTGAVRAALGVTSGEAPPMPAPRNPFPKA